MLAYCGLDCESCPILKATGEEDPGKKLELRIMIASELSKVYGIKMEPEKVGDCDGCRTENGRLFAGEQKCPVRICAREKGVENCAYCSTYPCKELISHFEFDPASKDRLDNIRLANNN